MARSKKLGWLTPLDQLQKAEYHHNPENSTRENESIKKFHRCVVAGNGNYSGLPCLYSFMLEMI